MCQSLGPFYTRTVKLPFLSKEMLKIMQTYSFSNFILFVLLQGQLLPHFIYKKILQASQCEPGTLLFLPLTGLTSW